MFLCVGDPWSDAEKQFFLKQFITATAKPLNSKRYIAAKKQCCDYVITETN